jgi:hypothetical protein
MKTSKNFDCVAMKNEIQRKLLARHRNMTETEAQADIRHKLETSRSSVGQLWRRLHARGVPSRHLKTVVR